MGTSSSECHSYAASGSAMPRSSPKSGACPWFGPHGFDYQVAS
jgi:hypothetical protein